MQNLFNVLMSKYNGEIEKVNITRRFSQVIISYPFNKQYLQYLYSLFNLCLQKQFTFDVNINKFEFKFCVCL